MTAEFSLALDANTGLCVCPLHVNCFRHSVVPSAVTTTSIRYAWVLRYGAKYVQLHKGTARAALWNETDQHLAAWRARRYTTTRSHQTAR